MVSAPCSGFGSLLLVAPHCVARRDGPGAAPFACSDTGMGSC